MTVVPIENLGTIEEIGSGLRWDANTLANEVRRRTATLAQIGLGRNAMAAIGHGGSAAFLADLFAVWASGAAAICLDGSLSPGELDNILRFSQPSVFLAGDGGVAPPSGLNVLDLRHERTARHEAAEAASHPDDPALILFTSGTTGAPKGVVLSFRALAARINLNLAAIGTEPLSRTLVTLPMHFGHGLIGNALTPLAAGGDLILPAAGTTLGRELGRLIDECRITFLTSVPALWPLALRMSREPSRRSLRRLHIGSAPLARALWAEVADWTGAETVNCYGATENANWISGASSRSAGFSEGDVGKMWGGAAAILTEDGEIHRHGTGEIVLRTPSLMSGYLHRPELTAAAMHDGWYRTGDRGFLSESGEIRLSGRLKDEINRGGFKIQPADIDALLGSHPAISEACAFAVPDPVAGEILGVAVQLADGAKETAESLRDWCRARLRREAVPERWFIVDTIPRNARGKIGRDTVRRQVLQEEAHAPADRSAG